MLFVAFLVLGCSLPLFAQNPPHITGTSENLDDQKVVLTPEEQAWLQAHPEIQLGYLVAEPEIIANADGTYSGMLVDFLDALNRKLGINIGLHIDLVPGLIEKVKEKKIDGILALHPEYADKLGLLKTQDHWPGYPAVFARKGEAFKGPGDFKDRRVAIVEQVHWTRDLIRQYGNNTTVIEVKSPLEGLQSVEKGTADFYLGASNRAYFINKYQLLNITVAYVFQDSPALFGIGVRADWPQLVTILDKALALFSEKEINDIIAHWSYLPSVPGAITLTQQEEAWIAENPLVRVRVGNYPPNYFVRDGTPHGIAIDLLNIVARQTGIQFSYDLSPPPFSEDLRGIQEHSGPDLLPSLQSTPEREEVLLFTEPYSRSPRFIFIRTDSPFIDSMKDLEGRAVAVEKGYLLEKWLAESELEIKPLVVASSREALAAVSSGKAFAYIGPLRPTAIMINRFGYTNLKAVAPSSLPDGLARMAVRDDWPELHSIIGKVLKSIPEEEKSTILNRWSPVMFETGVNLLRIVYWGLIFSGTFMMVLFLLVVWNRTLKTRVDQRTADLQKTIENLACEVEQRMLAEKNIAAKEAEEFALINAVSHSFFLMGTDGTIVVANSGLASHYGVKPETLLGTSIFELVPEHIAESRRLHVDRAMASKQLYTFSDEHSGKFYEHRLYPISDESGAVYRFAVLTTDISATIETQRKVEESEKRFRATFEQAAVGIAHVAPDGHFLRINEKFCTIAGYDRERLLELSFQDITHPDDLAVDLEQVNKVLAQTLDYYSIEKRYITENEAIVWVNLTVSLVRDEAGKPQYFVSVIEDISSRKDIENALRTSESQLSALVEQSPLSIQMFNTEGKITRVNKAWMELWGIAEELVDDVLDKYNVLEDEEVRDQGIMPFVERAFLGESAVLPIIEYDADITLQRLDINDTKAAKRWVQMRIYPLIGPTGEVETLVSIEEDVTRRVMAEQALRESEEMFRGLIEQSPLSTVINNPDGTISKVNKAFMDLWDIKEKDLPILLEKYNVLEDPEIKKLGIQPFVEKAFQGESVVFPVVEYNPASTKEDMNIDDPEPEKRWVQVQMYPIKSESGEVLKIVVIEEDITQRKIAEEQVQRYQERLKALGSQLTIAEETERTRIATGLHDHVGQILAFSRIQLNRAKKLAHGDDMVKILEEISDSLIEVITDTKELIFDLSSPLLHEIGLEAAIASWLDNLKVQSHGIDFIYEQNLGNCGLDHIERTILFRNFKELVTNAIKHAQATQIRVSLSRDGMWLNLEVTDNGIGFDPQYIGAAATHTDGFGLFSIQERMEDIGGICTIDTQLEKGSRLCLTLPMDK